MLLTTFGMWHLWVVLKCTASMCVLHSSELLTRMHDCVPAETTTVVLFATGAIGEALRMGQSHHSLKVSRTHLRLFGGHLRFCVRESSIVLLTSMIGQIVESLVWKGH